MKNTTKKAVFNFFKLKAETTEFIRNTMTALACTLKPIESAADYEKMFCKHTDGDKMDGMTSLSTCPTLNFLCVLRSHIDGLICKHCYSMTMNKRFANLRKKLERNTYYLTQKIIPFEYIPYINAVLFRLESFGDLQNEIQAINYLNLITKNSHVSFAWWTKNPQFIKKALNTLGIEKPSNVQIIFSSPCMNKAADIEILKKVFPFIDKVFTVFDKEFIKNNPNVVINCGSRKCRECQNCYRADGVKMVCEVVK